MRVARRLETSFPVYSAVGDAAVSGEIADI